MTIRFVFQARLRPGCTEQQYIDAWRRGSKLVQGEPGAKGTIMHRSLDHPALYMAIATWDSKQARDEAMAKLYQSDAETLAVWNEDENYAEFLLENVPLGHFEEIAHVDPKKQRNKGRLVRMSQDINSLLARMTEGVGPDVVPVGVLFYHLNNDKAANWVRKLGFVETLKRGGGIGGDNLPTPSRYLVKRRRVTPEELEQLLDEAGL